MHIAPCLVVCMEYIALSVSFICPLKGYKAEICVYYDLQGII